MNPNKICFIYCVNDEFQYAESAAYVQSLHVPDGFEVDVMAVFEASSITEAYNYAMKNSDAKYKVYLHQDVLIINKQFIVDVVSLFQRHSRLGMLGMVGSRSLPPNGVWWEHSGKVGKVYDSHTGKMELLSFQEVTADYEPVVGVDGLLLVTQYDVPWRDDLLKGWHFYDLSQSMEFRKAGYEVGVPRQEKPWCIHDCGIVNVRNGFDENRRLFLEEYAELLFPKVSVLIPTYNRPHYFEQALNSALNQTYKPIEIIVCDDSTNDETERLIQSYLAKHSNIRYYKNETNLGQFENDLKCMELASGEYVNFLMDDDLFHPEKIEKMMRYFLEDPDKRISLVTSHRQLIDGNGNPLPDLNSTQRLFDRDTMVDGFEMGDYLLTIPANLIGEPTTVLFRKEYLDEPFGTFSGRRYICNVDLASWLNLLAKGRIVYIAQTLSYFRFHDGQQQQSKKMSIGGMNDFAHQIIRSPGKGFFQGDAQYVKAIDNCLRYMDGLYNLFDWTDDDKQSAEYRQSLVYYQMLKQKRAEIDPRFELNEQPLVSVLIPTYNRPHYLEVALKSVLNQTYKPIEIIICDDSTNDETEKMIQPYLNRYNQIRYYKNAQNLFLGNFYKCLELARGNYVNYLMDDDLFHEEKIEKMLQFFIRNPDVVLVTSHRDFIDGSGNVLPDQNPKWFERTQTMDGRQLGSLMLEIGCNLIGEPTTAMFKKSALREHFGHFQGKEYSVLNDLATWIQLMSGGKVGYIASTLSYFRQHDGQNQKNPKYLKESLKDWFQLIHDSREEGFLTNLESYKNALCKYLKQSVQIVEFYNQIRQSDQLKPYLTYPTEAFHQLVHFPDKYT
jgi:glycosyltransferase involved in cell wall biosynthesis